MGRCSLEKLQDKKSSSMKSPSGQAAENPRTFATKAFLQENKKRSKPEGRRKTKQHPRFGSFSYCSKEYGFAGGTYLVLSKLQYAPRIWNICAVRKEATRHTEIHNCERRAQTNKTNRRITPSTQRSAHMAKQHSTTL